MCTFEGAYGKKMKIAYLYAGQGAQHAGMGQELYEKEAAFRKFTKKIYKSKNK